MKIVKYIANIENPTVNLGFDVDGKIVFNAQGNFDYRAVLKWIDEGNTPLPAFTQSEIDLHQEEFTYQGLVSQLRKLTVEYEGNTFSGNIEAQSFIVAMIIKIEGETPSATRNIYAINGRTKVPMTKTQLNELISIIDIAQESISNA